MSQQDEGRDTPTPETPPLSTAERFARLLSQEDGGADEPDTGAALPKKPGPVTDPSVEAEEALPEGSDEGDDAGQDESKDTETPRYKVKVDGEEVEVPLDELLKGYSFSAHNTRTAQKLAAERKALEAKAAEAAELTTQYRAVLPKLEEIAKQAVDKYAGVDWDALRAEDPAAFAEHWAMYQREQAKLQSVTAEREAEDRKRQAEEMEQFNNWVASEQEQLLVKVPEWKDETKRNDEMAKVAKFAAEELGFTPEDLAQTFDHRVIRGLRLAWLGSQVLAKAGEAQRKVREARKTAAPGKRPEDTPADAERLKQARARLRTSGREADAADAFNALYAKRKE